VGQNALLGTLAGTLGLLHLRSSHRHGRFPKVTWVEKGEKGSRDTGVSQFLTPPVFRYVGSNSPNDHPVREVWSCSERSSVTQPINKWP
jgi:hypothetical protein